jgi:hypothetical protein
MRARSRPAGRDAPKAYLVFYTLAVMHILLRLIRVLSHFGNTSRTYRQRESRNVGIGAT